MNQEISSINYGANGNVTSVVYTATDVKYTRLGNRYYAIKSLGSSNFARGVNHWAVPAHVREIFDARTRRRVARLTNTKTIDSTVDGSTEKN